MKKVVTIIIIIIVVILSAFLVYNFYLKNDNKNEPTNELVEPVIIDKEIVRNLYTFKKLMINLEEKNIYIFLSKNNDDTGDLIISLDLFNDKNEIIQSFDIDVDDQQIKNEGYLKMKYDSNIDLSSVNNYNASVKLPYVPLFD